MLDILQRGSCSHQINWEIHTYIDYPLCTSFCACLVVEVKVRAICKLRFSFGDCTGYLTLWNIHLIWYICFNLKKKLFFKILSILILVILRHVFISNIIWIIQHILCHVILSSLILVIFRHVFISNIVCITRHILHDIIIYFFQKSYTIV